MRHPVYTICRNIENSAYFSRSYSCIPCNSYNKHRLFRVSQRCFWRSGYSVTWRCVIERCSLYCLTLKMKAKIYFETLTTVHPTTHHHTPVHPVFPYTPSNHCDLTHLRSIGTFLYLTVVPSHFLSSRLWKFALKWITCLLDVTRVCQQKENITRWWVKN
jgi:hypothetical protein